MKKRICIKGLGLLLLLSLVAGCRKPDEEPESGGTEPTTREIQAEAESLTPPEVVFHWQLSDSLAVYSPEESQPARFTMRRVPSASSARFTGIIAGDNLIALYPYGARTNSGLRGKELGLQLPASQDYVKNGVDKRALAMVAVSGTETLSFQHLCGILKLPVTGDATVTSLRLTPKNKNLRLSGNASVKTDFSGAPVLQMQAGASESVTIQSPKGITLKENGTSDFYIVLPPGTYTGGFSIDITTYSGDVSLEMDTDLVLERARIVSAPTISCYPGGEVGPDNLPRNQIWYTTGDGQPLQLVAGCFPQRILSNEYADDGWCKVVFDGPVTRLGKYAFSFTNLTDLRLPDCVETLGERAVSGTSITAFRTPESLNRIHRHAFALNTELKRFYGKWASADESSIILSDGTLAAYAPGLLDGVVEIPEGAVALADSLFFRESNIREVVLPEGLQKIGAFAFWNQYKLEQVMLSSSVREVGRHAFSYCPQLSRFLGINNMIRDGNALVDANGTLVAVAGAGLSDYEMPADATILGSGVFAGMDQLKSITFRSELQNFYSDSIIDCRNLEFFYGQGTTEDHHGLVFNGDYLVKVTPVCPRVYTVDANIRRIFSFVFENNTSIEQLIIPDAVYSIGRYCFRGMSGLQSLQLPSSLTELGAQAFDGCKALEHLYLRSWYPPSYPSDGGSGFGHNGLAIHVPEGTQVYYKTATGWSTYARYIQDYKYTDLADPTLYRSTDFSQNGAVSVLQTASEGRGIDVVLMGDGFSDRQMNNGIYDNIMRQMADALLGEEPFASYRKLFNVYAVKVVSPSEGYQDKGQALGTWFGEGTEVGGNDKTCMQYALNAISQDRMDNALIVVAMNSSRYGGTCIMYSSQEEGADYGTGTGIAYLPISSGDEVLAQVVRHEAGGHGFAKLADEYSGTEGTIPAAEKKTYTDREKYGWWKNIDFTGDPNAVKWQAFLADTRYQFDCLGCFEGACEYSYGAWRATKESIMRYNAGGFNAPSREAIWYRIHKLAYGSSWTYSHEDFVKYDAVNRKTKAERGGMQLAPLNAPCVMEGSWSSVFADER